MYQLFVEDIDYPEDWELLTQSPKLDTIMARVAELHDEPGYLLTRYYVSGPEGTIESYRFGL